jgi:hypothetical protein
MFITNDLNNELARANGLIDMLAEIIEAETEPGADMSPEFIATMEVL